jgi:hypothetical protein
LGGGAALAASPFVPGVRGLVSGGGDAVAGAAKGIGKSVGSPIGRAAVSVLGPVAVLSLLYGLSKGMDSTKDKSKQLAEIKALRAGIRKREIEEQPYYALQPSIKVPGEQS